MTDNYMNVTSAKYQQVTDDNNQSVNVSIKATIGGEVWIVPINTDSRRYRAIQAWVADGNTIADAD
jgi:hypothetical protein